MNIIKKVIKYIVLFAILFITVIFITKSKIDKFDCVAIALIGVASYALADQYAPSYIIEEKV